ncbi:MAG: hypothetical protein HW380_1738 [Magnetococcales bacterium]|nr:hypothetical protein [Magnetococcales bacterium]
MPTTNPKPDAVQCISVQSAKGGAGKTLISFLLADQLRKRYPKGRAVVLDLDFTGTSAADLMMCDADGNTALQHVPVHVVRKRKKNVKLLELYQERLQAAGEGISAEFIRSLKAPDHHVIHFTSGLAYGDGISETLLSDANHAVWFCDFLFDLFLALEKGFKSSPDNPLHIILDHPPGQSELTRQIQEKLLQWGVHRARFLQITTLDTMDVQACVLVLWKIHNQRKMIRATKEVLQRIRDAGKEDTLSELLCEEGKSRSKNFDWDLLEAWIQEEEPGKGRGFHISLDDVDLSDAGKYLFLVFNRISATVDLAHVGKVLFNQILTNLANESKEIGQDIKPFLSSLSLTPLPFEPALTVIFQEAFLTRNTPASVSPKENVTSFKDFVLPKEEIPTVASVDEGTQKTFSEEYNAWIRLINRDAYTFLPLFNGKKRFEATSKQQILLRNLTPQEGLHFVRGAQVVLNLFHLCSCMINTEDHHELVETPPHRQFQDAVLSVCQRRFEEDEAKYLRDFITEEPLQLGRFFIDTISQIDQLKTHIDMLQHLDWARREAETLSNANGMVPKLARSLFPIFALFQIDEDSRTPAPHEDEIKKSLKRFWALAIKLLSLYNNPDTHNWPTFRSTLAKVLDLQDHNLDRVDIYQMAVMSLLLSMRATENSLTSDKIFSPQDDLFLRIWFYLRDNSVTMGPMTEFYLINSLTSLLNGWRNDTEAVVTEISNLISNTNTATTLAGPRRMAAQLDDVISRWMVTL